MDFWLEDYASYLSRKPPLDIPRQVRKRNPTWGSEVPNQETTARCEVQIRFPYDKPLSFFWLDALIIARIHTRYPQFLIAMRGLWNSTAADWVPCTCAFSHFKHVSLSCCTKEGCWSWHRDMSIRWCFFVFVILLATLVSGVWWLWTPIEESPEWDTHYDLWLNFYYSVQF